MKDNIRIATLVRLAEAYVNNIDQKLFNTKSKQGIKNHIYKITENLTKGRFRDDNWSNVRKVFDAVEEAGFNINWGAENGGYSPDGMRKTYQFTIDFTNAFGTDFTFSGQLICSFCGPMNDPTSVYDMIFQIF